MRQSVGPHAHTCACNAVTLLAADVARRRPLTIGRNTRLSDLALDVSRRTALVAALRSVFGPLDPQFTAAVLAGAIDPTIAGIAAEAEAAKKERLS